MLEEKIKLPLLTLRLGVFIVLAVWTLDKFINPEHTAAVWAKFYAIGDIGSFASYAAGSLQAAVLLAFLLGYFKKFAYGFILVMHAIGTLAPVPQYLAPYEGLNILFFAAWPMLAACFTLFMLRDYDTLLSPGSRPGSP